jgi:heat-inducible transcriptional repressor
MSNETHNRKLLVLRAVIHEYLETAEPVSSSATMEKHRIGASSATIRNDMAELEEEGFLEQPHTSAGRIPTEKGYKLYVQELVERDRRVAKFEQGFTARLAEVQKEAEAANARDIAKVVSQETGQTVVVSVPSGGTHVAGLAHLMRKPEFRESEALAGLTEVLDEMDELLADVFPQLSRDVQVLIGSENPFGTALSSVLMRYDLPEGSGVIGILGPTRMDYDQNIAMLRSLTDALMQRRLQTGKEDEQP